MPVTPPPPNAPSDSTTNADLTSAPALPLPDQGIGSEAFWSEEVTQAKKRRKKELPLWKANLSRYRGERPKLPGVTPQETITVNIDFYKTEAKKAQLFFQTPQVTIAPKGIGTPQTIQIASLKATVVNYYLSAHEINAAAMVDQVLLDHLCPAGFGASVLGYESVTTQVSAPVDPTNPQLGAQQVPQRIWCRFYWDRIDPAKLLIPSQYLSTDFERAPWLGYEVDLDVDQAADARLLPRRDLGTGPVEDSLAAPYDREFLTETTHAYVLWYRASVYDPTVSNPDLFRRLVLVSGDKSTPRVAVHEPSPFQQVDAQGKLTSGMRGNPIHLLTLRPMTGSAYPPSDCAISRAAADELSQGRTQMMLQKRRSLPQRGFDRNKVDAPLVNKLEAGDIQGLIPFDGPPHESLEMIALASFPRESFEFNEIIERDIDQMWALGANQQGVAQATGKTATEAALMQRATDSRMTKERNRVLAWYAAGAEKLSALLDQFGTEDDLTPLIGPTGVQMWMQFKQQGVATRFLFDIKPDSSERQDAAEEQTTLLNAYNIMARDPHVNRIAILTRLAEAFGWDPSQVIVPQLPPPPVDVPKITLTLTAQDLQDPSVIQVLAQCNIHIEADIVTQHMAAAGGQTLPQPPGPPGTPAPASPPQQAGPGLAPAPPPMPHGRPPMVNSPHPGAAERMAPIAQHQADRTGERPGPKTLQ